MKGKRQLLRVYSQPQLKEPFLIAAGPGTANVAITVTDYLRDKLGAELFAEIEPGDFFAPPYSFTFQDGLIKLAPLDVEGNEPQNRFYYWKSGKEHDLVFFLGNTHPLPGKIPELADYVLDLARSFNVTRIFTAGAFLTDIYHLDEPVIYSVATNKEMRLYLDSLGVPPSPPMNIAHNLIAWLLGTAKKKRLDAIGLVSEIPFYNAEGENVRACRALVSVLSQILDLGSIDLSSLDYRLGEEEAQIAQRLEELSGSTDERAVNFLRYVDELRGRRRDFSVQNTLSAVHLELPEHLRHIEQLYSEAKDDKSRAAVLNAELDKLGSFDRLLVLRKFGKELLRLLGRQI